MPAQLRYDASQPSTEPQRRLFGGLQAQRIQARAWARSCTCNKHILVHRNRPPESVPYRRKIWQVRHFST